MTHYITETRFPQVTNCTRCDADLLRDGAVRVQLKKAGKVWPTIAWLCHGCAK